MILLSKDSFQNNDPEYCKQYEKNFKKCTTQIMFFQHLSCAFRKVMVTSDNPAVAPFVGTVDKHDEGAVFPTKS